MRNHFIKKNTSGLYRQILCLILTYILVMLTGCTPDLLESSEEIPMEGNLIQMGTQLEIEKPDDRFTLRDHKDALAADGLYYISWSMGETESYESSDGDTIDLYDAQLHLLLSECRNDEDARKACSNWLEAARENYEVSEEEEIICNEQAYTCIHYQCPGKENPYDRGVSAFATSNSNAVCIEFTCQKDFTEDLQQLLTDFLNGCHYKTD